MANTRSIDFLQVVCTLPVVFSTAIYALHHQARIQFGETVLIHDGGSEVGNAAIQVAKLAGVQVRDFILVTLELPASKCPQRLSLQVAMFPLFRRFAGN